MLLLMKRRSTERRSFVFPRTIQFRVTERVQASFSKTFFLSSIKKRRDREKEKKRERQKIIIFYIQIIYGKLSFFFFKFCLKFLILYLHNSFVLLPEGTEYKITKMRISKKISRHMFIYSYLDNKMLRVEFE